MANHLREIVEIIETGDILVPAEASPGWRKFAPEFLAKIGLNAICFDAGHVDGLYGFKVIPELARLPFETCWVEVEADEYIFCALLRESELGNLSGHIWSKDKKTRDWMFRGAFLCDAITKRTAFQAVRDPAVIEGLNDLVAAFRCFLTAINCTNVRRIEHKPDAKLQKARAKRGKQPLFSYWTLELDLSRAESNESLGGTHASPRLHLRRGHARQYAPGKFTWVQPCVVGNKAAGIIHKDYRVAA